MNILIIGLGNPLVTDDSVGLRVAAELKPRLAGRSDVEVSEDYWGGLRLMERMIGFDRVIVVDAIQTGAAPGTIHHLTPEGIATQRSTSAHDVNLSTALEFGRQAGVRLPDNQHIRLVGVEAEDILTFGQPCTPAVEAAIPQAVEAVMELLASISEARQDDLPRDCALDRTPLAAQGRAVRRRETFVVKIDRSDAPCMTSKLPKLILASRSPRRRELLAAAGYRFEVQIPTEAAECGVCSGETPSEFVARLAYQKAADVAREIKRGLVLGCDTVAECQGRILGKPTDQEQALAMLQLLTGRMHRVFSGLCLLEVPAGEPVVRVAVTTLRMDQLTAPELDAYLATGQWEGKAGAFGYQDGLDWVHVVDGSESNVVGLPMELLAEMIESVVGR